MWQAIKEVLRLIFIGPDPVYGFCKDCEKWTVTKFIKVYRSKLRKVCRQATCRKCGKWRWG